MFKPPAFLVLLVYLCTCLESANSLTSCTQKSACSCESPEGMINLSPLATHGTTPRLKLDHGSDTTFYYNPCYNFDMGTVKDAGVVQYQHGASPLYFSLGSNKDVTMSIVSDSLQIKLSGGDKRETYIEVVCSTSVKITYVKEDPTYSYYLKLEAPEGCPGYVPPSGSSSLSIGSILVIGFFVILVCYIGFGVAFQVFVRKTSGKETIPNLVFWTALPGLIKDGAVFTFTFGKRSKYSSMGPD